MELSLASTRYGNFPQLSKRSLHTSFQKGLKLLWANVSFPYQSATITGIRDDLDSSLMKIHGLGGFNTLVDQTKLRFVSHFNLFCNISSARQM